VHACDGFRTETILIYVIYSSTTNNNHDAVTWVLACGVSRESVGRAELSLKKSVTKMVALPKPLDFN
jgi:hypothetical protein